jgi:hypothetical protein
VCPASPVLRDVLPPSGWFRRRCRWVARDNTPARLPRTSSSRDRVGRPVGRGAEPLASTPACSEVGAGSSSPIATAWVRRSRGGRPRFSSHSPSLQVPAPASVLVRSPGPGRRTTDDLVRQLVGAVASCRGHAIASVTRQILDRRGRVYEGAGGRTGSTWPGLRISYKLSCGSHRLPTAPGPTMLQRLHASLNVTASRPCHRPARASRNRWPHRPSDGPMAAVTPRSAGGPRASDAPGQIGGHRDGAGPGPLRPSSRSSSSGGWAAWTVSWWAPPGATLVLRGRGPSRWIRPSGDRLRRFVSRP